jgi:hypothetical protein
MDISPEHLKICLAVLQQLAKYPELMEQNQSLKPLIHKVYRKNRRAEQKKTTATGSSVTDNNGHCPTSVPAIVARTSPTRAC